jgi:aminopeptidase 2
LGADVFQRGISAYLKKYSFGNAKTEDLWRSLGEASGKDVASYMDTWTAIVGFPLVTVSRGAAADGSSSLQVSQERFLADATAPRDTASVWPVPLKVAFYASATSAPVIVETVMTAASATVKSPLPAYSHVKVNYGQSGFFRTQYSPELFAALAANVATLPTNDRAALLSDMDALARAGKASAVDALSLLSHYTAERDYSVWVNLSSLLGAIHFVWASEPEDVRRALDALGRQLLSNIDHAVGWDARPTDGHLDGLLRSLIVPLAAKFKDQATLAEAITRFDAGKVPNDVRGGIFPAVAAHSDAYLKKMQALLESSTDAAITVACVGALGAASTTEAVVDMLEYGLSSGKVRGQDYFYIWGSASSNPVGRLATWKFAVDNWDRLNKHLAGTSSLLGSCLSSAISGLTDLDMIKEAEDFLAARPVEGIAMTIKQAIEAARARARWLQRDRDHVRKFFKL